MPRSLLLLSLVLAGCPASDDKTTEETGGGDACAVQVDSTIPSSGAMNADYRAAIEFQLSDADPTAVASSADIAGTSTITEDDVVVFTPDAPLAPSTSYTVTLDYCGGTVDLSFSTSELGAPLETDLTGKTYALALSDARILEPAGVGSVLKGYLTQDILVGVQSTSDTSILMVGAIGKEDSDPPAQDYCDPTIDFPEANFENAPFFAIGPRDTSLSVADITVEIGNLEITGTFAPDGSYFGGGTLGGTIDTRPLASLLGEDTGDVGAICDLAASFGAICQACPVDNEPYCLTLVADQITASEVEGTSIVVIEGSDCTGCVDGPPAEDAVCL